ncbi:MAG: hypothetical protein ACR2NH_00135 [Solirubrobacteraceae bacterium]
MHRLGLAVLILVLVVAAGASAAPHPRQSGGTTPGKTPGSDNTGADATANPCVGEGAGDLRCPDLRMGAPTDLYAQIGRRRTVLRAANRLQNVGDGPMELRGRRKRPLRAFRMDVTQAIRKSGRGYLLRKTGGELFFKPVPGQYRYWKFVDAASLEIWSLDDDGKPKKMVRRSPKQVYCLRDLLRMADPPRGAPGGRVYPGCNQDPDKRRVTLGTSVGWVDRYPAQYYQQYVDVTGLKGRFAYVMTADPKNHLAESDEANNSSSVVVTLPLRRQGYLPGY